MRRRVSLCVTVACAAVLCRQAAAQPAPRLDPALQALAGDPTGRSFVLVQPLNGSVDVVIQSIGGTLGRALPLVNARAADVPDSILPALAANAAVERVALDRPTFRMMERTGATIGATAVRDQLGYDGRGIGVALVDSGIAAHDDLRDPVTNVQRIDGFVDFVNGQSAPYDDLGHGTHVAGIIAGNGFDSSGARTGIAPAARLLSLKVLDGSGAGRISHVIDALDYALAHRMDFNIRIVNVSIGAAVTESYLTDMLAQATRRAVEQGVVVVAAAGNLGRRADGAAQAGGITAPGNAPWVLTVGASSHMGTVDRSDDTVAAFSSRGPTAIDHAAKPDLVAPGVGIVTMSPPVSRFASSYATALLNGTVPAPFPPYLSLSGTSMAAPVVSGTVALMLQANPWLTPNAVKAILQYTAEPHPEYDWLTEGAGFLNARGAVLLAQFFAAPASAAYPSDPTWSRRVIWGNHLPSTGRALPGVNAWSTGAVWGTDHAPDGQPIVWGETDAGSPWAFDELTAWGSGSENVVWGPACGGRDCPAGTSSTSSGDTVVWGTSGGDTVVWGTSCGASCS